MPTFEAVNHRKFFFEWYYGMNIIYNDKTINSVFCNPILLEYLAGHLAKCTRDIFNCPYNNSLLIRCCNFWTSQFYELLVHYTTFCWSKHVSNNVFLSVQTCILKWKIHVNHKFFTIKDMQVNHPHKNINKYGDGRQKCFLRE